MKTIYIAGPMRGYPRYNFDAFHHAEDCLSMGGWTPINPARIDLENGFDPDGPVTPTMMDAFIRRDFECIMRVEGIAVLPGWEKSVGATAEVFMALWRGIPVYAFPSMVPIEREAAIQLLFTMQTIAA